MADKTITCPKSQGEHKLIMPRSLDYSRPLFAGGFRYRSLAGAVGLAIWVGMGIFAAWMLWQFFPNQFFPILVPILAIGFGGLAVVHVIWMIGGKVRGFSIETAGIVNNGRFTAWSEISRFMASGQQGGTHLTLFYEKVSPPLNRSNLASSRRISTEEYEELIRRLREAGVEEAHPQLKLGGYHQDAA